MNLALVQQLNKPVLIIVLCLVVLKACMPLSVFYYTVAVLCGSLLFTCNKGYYYPKVILYAKFEQFSVTLQTDKQTNRRTQKSSSRRPTSVNIFLKKMLYMVVTEIVKSASSLLLQHLVKHSNQLNITPTDDIFLKQCKSIFATVS